MLKVLRQGQRWIMGLVILVVGGVFVAFVGVGGPLFRGGGGDAVVEVDGRRFGARDLLRVRAGQEAEAKEMLGDSFDSKALASQLDLMAANALVQGAILAREAERLGLRVGDDEIVEVVKQIPAFKDEQGRFRPDAVKDYIQYEYGTERRFLDALRQQLLAQKVLRLISETAGVSESEAREALRRKKERVELAYVAIDATKAGSEALVTDEQADALLAKDEARVKDFYDAHPDRFNAPEKVRARHILVRVPRDASEDQVNAARERAVALRKRVESGEEFAKVAREASEDPGSKENGGDLGFFQRGQMVKPFEEVAFLMQPGSISDVVKTDFGFHVIEVEEKKAAESRSFEDAKREIAKELIATDAAKQAARERVEALAKRVREGQTLEQAARADALTLERTPAIERRSDGFIPGLGAAPDVLTAAFQLTPEKPSAERVFEVGDKLVLIQLLRRIEASSEELAKEIPAARARLLEEERRRMESAWLQAQHRVLAEAGRLHVDLQALTRQ
ncbi:MAG: peptidylprolyl isomerase [Deltaproteobacteria bacterium]|nr:peptidylprolyl isomerase [Deltaproteobacteria bacterium]